LRSGINFSESLYYSVPHHLCRLEVQVQATRESVAVFYKGQQVARHPRNHLRGQYTTNTTQSERLLQWGCSIGPDTHKLVEIMLSRKRHPEKAYRSCLGLLNLAKQYDNNRLNNACRRAIEINSPNYRSVKSILSKRLDNLVETPETLDQRHQSLLNDHDNIRGPMYYH